MSHQNYLSQMVGDGATMNILTNKTKYQIKASGSGKGVYFLYQPALKARRNLHITIPDSLNMNRVHVTNKPVGASSNEGTAYYSNSGEFIQRLTLVLDEERRDWVDYKRLKKSNLQFATYLRQRTRRSKELTEARNKEREDAEEDRKQKQREAQNKLQRQAEAERERQKIRNREMQAKLKLQRQAQEQLARQLNQQNRVNQEKLENFKKLALKEKGLTVKQQSRYNSLRTLAHIKKFMAETTNNKYNFVRARTRRRAEAAGEAESRKENAARAKRNKNVEKEKNLLLNFDPRIPTQANFERIMRNFHELRGDINKAKSILRQINRWERGKVRLNNLNANTILNFNKYYYRKLQSVQTGKGHTRRAEPEYHRIYFNYKKPVEEALTKRETNMNELKQTEQFYKMLESSNTSIGLIKNALKNFPNNGRIRNIYLQALRR